MIISASRRTDIPTFYSDWFFNRIKEGFVLVRNPMNFRQVSHIVLTPDVVDGIILWTKNPAPMFGRLDELRDYVYYFQFTITSYGKDIEPNVPKKNTCVLPIFKDISKKIGADRIIWRYDPIFINERYNVDYHVHAFTEMARELRKYTRKVTISFIETKYKGLKSNNDALKLVGFPSEIQRELASALAEIAHKHDLSMDSCAAKIDLHEYGIKQARCIDDRLLSKLLASNLDIGKDKNQRQECGCVSSVDIGMYNTCMNGCLYCYANYSKGAIAGNNAKHNPFSPLLFGELGNDDKITDRAFKVYKNNQRQSRVKTKKERKKP